MCSLDELEKLLSRNLFYVVIVATCSARALLCPYARARACAFYHMELARARAFTQGVAMVTIATDFEDIKSL